MSLQQFTYWSVTINNPDDNDMLIVRNPNPKYVREWVWTPEQGENGTHHIQGWLRLQRNQAEGFVKKLYPRAHLRYCAKDEYNENAHNYAQKDDSTTRGKHSIQLCDPKPDVTAICRKVIEYVFDELCEEEKEELSREDVYLVAQRRMVLEDYTLAKWFVSPTYKTMMAEYGIFMEEHIAEQRRISRKKNINAS